MAFLQTIEELHAHDSKLIKKLCKKLNLSLPQFQKVKTLYDDKKYIQAGKHILDYFNQFGLDDRWKVPAPELVQKIDMDTSLILDNKFQFPSGVIDHPLKENGTLKWHYLGPDDDIEYGYRINRFAWLPTLFQTYKNLKNELEENNSQKKTHTQNKIGEIVRYVNRNLQDWIISNPRPFFKRNNETWRVLEAGLRLLLSWPMAFFGFKGEEEFYPATKLLLLYNIYDQAQYVRWWHAFMGNHLTIEMDGLATAVMCFPEFKKSRKWVKVATKNIQKELLKRQVYPDGIQKELSAHIHLLTLFHFDHFGQMYKKESWDAGIDPDYYKRIEEMWQYLVYSLKPDDNAPFNNDCPFYLRDWAFLLKKKAREYERKDWIYLLTHGKEGRKPDMIPSHVFPWAGQLIMKDSLENEGNWAFFDIGPSGISPSHLHRDKLHLSIHAYGKDLIIDTGFFHHPRDKWRNTYFNSTRGHNTILINGKGQKKEKYKTRNPIPDNSSLITEKFDFATGEYYGKYAKDKLGTRTRTYDSIKGQVGHKRAVFFRRTQYWVVIDKISTKRARNIQVLWHFHPACEVIIKKSVLHIKRDNVSLYLKPLTSSQEIDWEISKVIGQENPNVQGWFSPIYGEKVPAPTVIYECRVPSSVSFGWLIQTRDSQDEIQTMVEAISSKATLDEFSCVIKNKEKKQESLSVIISDDVDLERRLCDFEQLD